MSTEQLTGDRNQIPVGISTLDSMFDGGVPSGSFILLSGQVGAGAPEFSYTSASMVSMAKHDPELFSIYHDRGLEDTVLPEETHYVSFVRNEDDVLRELRSVLNDDMYNALVDNMKFKDFSQSYFHNTVVPRSWIDEDILSLQNLGKRGNGDDESLLSNFADYLDENAAGNLVLIDSLTSLVRATKQKLDWGDLLILLAGLQRACKEWDGLIYATLDRDTLNPREHQEIASVFDGILYFDWEEGEMQRQRTMYIGSFRGVMGRLSDQQDDKFETEVTDEGFEISSIRKIR